MMIKVEFRKDNIIVSGHANYKEYGNDIVCASVSSIIYTTINGILNINKEAIKFTDNDILEINILRNKAIDNHILN